MQRVSAWTPFFYYCLMNKRSFVHWPAAFFGKAWYVTPLCNMVHIGACSVWHGTWVPQAGCPGRLAHPITGGALESTGFEVAAKAPAIASITAPIGNTDFKNVVFIK